MGCDIHVHTEVKIDGLWHHYGSPYVDRYYTLFGYMAGVRNTDVIPISEPRGLPDDITLITWIDNDRYGIDGHSHSWLSGPEVTQLEELLKPHNEQYFYIERIFGYLFGNGWDFHEYPEEYPPQLEDARVVFWFDN